MIKKLVIFLVLIMAASCGGETPNNFSGGALAVVIRGARSFNPSIEPGHIVRYAVSIEGPGIASPIVGEFPGGATEGIIEGVPVGDGREVRVIALNANGATIRAGEHGDVSVDDGLTVVDVDMEAVPVFTNLADGSVIDNTRLIFRLFSDPSHYLLVEEVGANASVALADVSTGAAGVHLDAATGLGRMSPRPLEPGNHKFTVTDIATGRHSSVNVHLLDGAKRRPAPLVASAVAKKWGILELLEIKATP